MTFNPYPKYKASGVEWLGDVPAGWGQKRLVYLFQRKKDVNHVDEELLSVYRDYGVIPKSSRTDNFNKPSEDLSPYQLVNSGDLVLNKMKTWQGSIAISEYRGIVSPAYFVAAPRVPMHRRYMHHLLRCPQYIAEYRRLSGGVRPNQWDLDYDHFKNIPALLPSDFEQASIAAFLDRETVKIDTLVAKQESMIDLLKEKRQTMISHAVTKGLNATVAMKASGVEWLGDIPKHWTTTALKFASSMIVDCPHETPMYDQNGEFLVIRTADVSAARLTLDRAYRLDQKEYRRRTRRAVLLPYDIVYGREGERWGFAALVPETPLMCLGQRMMQIRAASGYNAAFLMWSLNSDNVYQQGKVDVVGATSPHVNVETIRNFRMTEPPLEEQKEIALFLERTVGIIDALIEKAQRAIALQKEHRTALISAAVTGKIDVRDSAAETRIAT